jgi:hypothetical protein
LALTIVGPREIQITNQIAGGRVSFVSNNLRLGGPNSSVANVHPLRFPDH